MMVCGVAVVGTFKQFSNFDDRLAVLHVFENGFIAQIHFVQFWPKITKFSGQRRIPRWEHSGCVESMRNFSARAGERYWITQNLILHISYLDLD
jgi:hypothetical protein